MSLCAIAQTSHEKRQCACRRVFNCRPKPLGSADLDVAVVPDLLDEFGFGFLKEPRLTHMPEISRAFANTSSAATNFANKPRISCFR